MTAARDALRAHLTPIAAQALALHYANNRHSDYTDENECCAAAVVDAILNAGILRITRENDAISGFQLTFAKVAGMSELRDDLARTWFEHAFRGSGMRWDGAKEYTRETFRENVDALLPVIEAHVQRERANAATEALLDAANGLHDLLIREARPHDERGFSAVGDTYARAARITRDDLRARAANTQEDQ